MQKKLSGQFIMYITDKDKLQKRCVQFSQYNRLLTAIIFTVQHVSEVTNFRLTYNNNNNNNFNNIYYYI